jgi:flagellar L-ring protein precursor FlgH
MRKLSLVIISSSLLFGCATTANRTVERDDPYYAPLHPEDTNIAQVNTGSLFNTRLLQR